MSPNKPCKCDKIQWQTKQLSNFHDSANFCVEQNLIYCRTRRRSEKQRLSFFAIFRIITASTELTMTLRPLKGITETNYMPLV